MQKWADYNPARPPIGAKPDLANASELGIVRAFLCNEGTGSPVEMMAQIVTNSASSVWPSWVIGRNGVCVKNGYCIYLDTVPLVQFPFSISGWVNPTSLSTTQYVASINQSVSTVILLRIQGSNWRVANGSNNVNTYPVSSGWQHVCAVITATALILYINGVNVMSSSVTNVLQTSLIKIGLGASSGGTPSPWLGQIESVLFHNIALSQDQVQGLYTSPYWWMQQPNYRRWFPNAGGTLHFYTASASQSSSAVLVKQPEPVKSASESNAATVVKYPQRILLATQGQFTALVRMISRTNSVAEGSTGTLLKQPQSLKSVSDGSAAVLLKQPQSTHSGTQAESAILIRQPEHILSAGEGSAASDAYIPGRGLITSAGSAVSLIKQPEPVRMALEPSVASVVKLSSHTFTIIEPTLSVVIKQPQINDQAAQGSSASMTGHQIALYGASASQGSAAVALRMVLKQSTVVQAQSSSIARFITKALTSPQPQIAFASKCIIRIIGPVAQASLASWIHAIAHQSPLIQFLVNAYIDLFQVVPYDDTIVVSAYADDFSEGGGTA